MLNPFDMFRSGASGAPQPQPNQNQQQQNQGGNPNDPNQNQNAQPNQNQNQNTNQQQNNNNGQPAENRSPLDEFKSLWETTPAPKDGEALPPNWDDHNSIVPEMKIDPKKLYESSKRIDFAKVMNPERVQAALKGDAGAFNEVINSVVQSAFAQSAMTMSKLVQAANTEMAEKLFTGALPHQLRKHTVNSQIDAENPIFADPAVAPMLEMVKAQMQVKYPKASAKEISDMAKKYVSGFAQAVSSGDGKVPQKTGGGKGGLNSKGLDGDMDWIEFATSSPQQ